MQMAKGEEIALIIFLSIKMLNHTNSKVITYVASNHTHTRSMCFPVEPHLMYSSPFLCFPLLFCYPFKTSHKPKAEKTYGVSAGLISGNCKISLLQLHDVRTSECLYSGDEGGQMKGKCHV